MPGPLGGPEAGPIVDLVMCVTVECNAPAIAAKVGKPLPKDFATFDDIGTPPEGLVTKARLFQGSHKSPHECSGRDSGVIFSFRSVAGQLLLKPQLTPGDERLAPDPTGRREGLQRSRGRSAQPESAFSC